MTGVVLGSLSSIISLLEVKSVFNVRLYQNVDRQMGSVDIKRSSLLEREYRTSYQHIIIHIFFL